MTDPHDVSEEPGRKPVAAMAGGIGLLFLAGGASGYIGGHVTRHIERGMSFDGRDAVVLGIGLLVLVSALYGLWRTGHYLMRLEGTGPRATRYRTTMVLSVVLGAVLSVVLLVGSGGDPNAYFGNGPLSPGVALLVSAGLLLLLPLSLWWQYRAIDEQEYDAVKSAALAALYAYMFAAPLWWFLARGGLVPPVDGPILYALVLAVFGAGWIWKKYR